MKNAKECITTNADPHHCMQSVGREQDLTEFREHVHKCLAVAAAACSAFDTNRLVDTTWGKLTVNTRSRSFSLTNNLARAVQPLTFAFKQLVEKIMLKEKIIMNSANYLGGVLDNQVLIIR